MSYIIDVPPNPEIACFFAEVAYDYINGNHAYAGTIDKKMTVDEIEEMRYGTQVAIFQFGKQVGQLRKF